MSQVRNSKPVSPWKHEPQRFTLTEKKAQFDKMYNEMLGNKIVSHDPPEIFRRAMHHAGDEEYAKTYLWAYERCTSEGIVPEEVMDYMIDLLRRKIKTDK